MKKWIYFYVNRIAAFFYFKTITEFGVKECFKRNREKAALETNSVITP